MKVILLKNVEKLGKADEVVEVTNGYARNFLLPKKLAVLATKAELQKLTQRKKKAAQKAEEELKMFQELASQLDGLDLEIEVKISSENKLFGAITAARISEELAKKGFKVKKEQIKLAEPIKELGEYEIAVQLPHNLEANIRVILTEEKKNDLSR